MHCLHAGFPICGDPKYCDDEGNAQLAQRGLKRLFLHAHSLSFIHPETQEQVTFKAPYDAQLTNIVKRLGQA